VGRDDGCLVGWHDGWEGLFVGWIEGCNFGLKDGCAEGEIDG